MSPLTPPPQRPMLGIVLMLIAMLAFSLNDVMGKWLVGTYGVAQLLLIRSFAGGLALAPALYAKGWRTLLLPQRPWLHALRAFCATAEVALFYWSVIYLPLADAVVFYLSGPIFITLFAIVLLGEKVGWRRWLAILVGFAGVTLAANPTGEGIGWPALIALAGTILFALANVLTRVLAGSDEITLVSWQVGAAFLFGLMVAPFRWVPPSLFDFGALMLLGLVGNAAHMAVNRSLRLAPASVVAPYQYTLIVWAVLLGFLFFGDWPKPHVLLGSAIIIASGLYIFIREQIKARETRGP